MLLMTDDALDSDFQEWVEIARLDRSWVSRASCRNLNVNIFFPTRGQSSEYAKQVCAGCEVKSECYEYSMKLPTNAVGIWGGESGRSRRSAHSKSISEKKVNHGTTSGINFHRKNGEKLCGVCLEFNRKRSREAMKEHRKKKKAEGK